MNITFSKMHGLGNDFVVIETLTQTFVPTTALLQSWSNRHTGIGFDQLLLIEVSPDDSNDFVYRIFNADGQEVEQCGNGARCAAKFVLGKNLSGKGKLRFQTKKGVVETFCLENGNVKVNMGQPELTPANIPFLAPQQANSYTLTLDNSNITCAAVSMGNPHCIIIVEDVMQTDVNHLGSLLTQHQQFPQGANVNFVEIVDATHIKLRVFERGVGETLACGSGACASVVASQLLGHVDTAVTVTLNGGSLQVNWQGRGHEVWSTGPAIFVFEGNITL